MDDPSVITIINVMRCMTRFTHYNEIFSGVVFPIAILKLFDAYSIAILQFLPLSRIERVYIGVVACHTRDTKIIVTPARAYRHLTFRTVPDPIVDILMAGAKVIQPAHRDNTISTPAFRTYGFCEGLQVTFQALISIYAFA